MQPRDILFIIFVILAIALFFEDSQPSPQQDMGKIIHSKEQVTKAIKDYLSIYYGLWGLEISPPAYRENLWQADVNYSVEGGGSSIRVYLNDTNLEITEIYEKAEVLKEPRGVTPILDKLSCSERGKLKVMLFSDPYCPFCIKYDKDVNQLLSKFQGSIDFEYHVLQTSSINLGNKFGSENVSLLSYYFICSQSQGKLTEFKQCATGKYLQHESVPLSKNELQECAQIAGLAQENLSTCLTTAKNTAGLDFSLAQTYLGNKLSTPTIVIDCRYKTSPKIVDSAICYYYNSTKGC